MEKKRILNMNLIRSIIKSQKIIDGVRLWVKNI